jgi:hypothetical protein
MWSVGPAIYSTEDPHFRVFRGTASCLLIGYLNFVRGPIYVTSHRTSSRCHVVQAVHSNDENVEDPRFPILQLLFMWFCTLSHARARNIAFYSTHYVFGFDGVAWIFRGNVESFLRTARLLHSFWSGLFCFSRYIQILNMLKYVPDLSGTFFLVHKII